MTRRPTRAGRGASSAISRSRNARPAACASAFSFRASRRARSRARTSEWEVRRPATPRAREPGYSKGFAMDVIANIRTDLDAFSEVEQAVLMNHGYALIDAAIRTHAGGSRMTCPTLGTGACNSTSRQNSSGSTSRPMRRLRAPSHRSTTSADSIAWRADHPCDTGGFCVRIVPGRRPNLRPM